MALCSKIPSIFLYCLIFCLINNCSVYNLKSVNNVTDLLTQLQNKLEVLKGSLENLKKSLTTLSGKISKLNTIETNHDPSKKNQKKTNITESNETQLIELIETFKKEKINSLLALLNDLDEEKIDTIFKNIENSLVAFAKRDETTVEDLVLLLNSLSDKFMKQLVRYDKIGSISPLGAIIFAFAERNKAKIDDFFELLNNISPQYAQYVNSFNRGKIIKKSFLDARPTQTKKIPSLQELTAKKFFTEIAAVPLDLTDGKSIDNLISSPLFSSFKKLIIDNYLKEQWKKELLSAIGVPLHIIPSSINKENDDLLHFNSGDDNWVIATLDPETNELFSLGKDAIKILSLVNGIYRKKDLTSIPLSPLGNWDSIVLNSKTKDLVIKSEKKLLILQKNKAGSYLIHKEYNSRFKGSPIIDEETGDIFCIGSTHLAYFAFGGEITRDEIYYWKQESDGSYGNPTIYFSSQNLIHVQLLRDDITHGCIVISLDKSKQNIVLNALDKETGASIHEIILCRKKDNYPGQHNQILAVHGQEKGELFIDSTPAEESSSPLEESSSPLLRIYRDGNNFRQENITMAPRAIWLDRSLADYPRIGMIYDDLSRLFIYSGYDSGHFYLFSRDLGTKTFQTLYRNKKSSAEFRMQKTANHFLLLTPENHTEEKRASHVYLYKLGFKKLVFTTIENMTQLKNASWNQLILLAALQKQAAEKESSKKIMLTNDYKADFNTIKFLLDENVVHRCQFPKPLNTEDW